MSETNYLMVSQSRLLYLEEGIDEKDRRIKELEARIDAHCKDLALCAVTLEKYEAFTPTVAEIKKAIRELKGESE